jgi:hypothetical protein
MLSSRKSEGAYRLPRGNCDENETPEEAVVRVLHDEAGIQVEKVTQRVGTYTEANKKGKIVGHHWIFEVSDPKILDSWPALDRKRVWVSLFRVIYVGISTDIFFLFCLNISSLMKKQLPHLLIVIFLV